MAVATRGQHIVTITRCNRGSNAIRPSARFKHFRQGRGRSQHAETAALRRVFEGRQGKITSLYLFRFTGRDAYVEERCSLPCRDCSGMIAAARIKHVYACDEEGDYVRVKAGFCGRKTRIQRHS